MRDCVAIAKNAHSVIVGPAYTKEITPFTTQIYSVDQSINIVMIECVCELCSCEHHCETECFECLECGSCACEQCQDKEVRGEN